MFEKEAIIHAFEETIGIGCLNKPVEDFTYEELSDELQEKAYDFKKGAEFGYNKCKEELNQKGLALQSDMDKTIEQNIALKKELNKVKEWHYIKDGDLPNTELEEKRLLVRVRNYNEDCFFAYYMLDKYFDKNGKRFYFDIDCDDFIDIEDVIAWKEIVLPELPKGGIK